ncbi:unnamed protein product [Candidula unifasciata]|uniref:Uncharacterized protein n=1 Tax=Candidula unifasciata TaxID=100452 RepID=A0A8S3ZEK1_9EUPU|nr:unnamed protein product [Candidula unifasciata]
MDIQTAVMIITKAWIRYRDKQMFRLLKHSVCAAENSLSFEILRKVSPLEAKMLCDKSQQVKVRFRFGGEEFPPLIFFKIFIHGAAPRVNYISGRKMIRPTSEAAEDSLRQMGKRLFYDHLLKDAIQHQHYSVTDEIDITTLKDYMQYLAVLDESPAWQGGKENYWRKLTLDDLPRHTMFFDVVDFAYNNQVTSELKETICTLMMKPVTQEIQIQHIQAISKLKAQRQSGAPPQALHKSKAAEIISDSRTSSRRSKQARLKASRMRHLYSREHAEQNLNDKFHDEILQEKSVTLKDDEEEELDAEASLLYEWTQELSFQDDLIQIP